MCISAEALAAFLNLLNPDIIDLVDSYKIIIHATEGPVTWLFDGSLWCVNKGGNV